MLSEINHILITTSKYSPQDVKDGSRVLGVNKDEVVEGKILKPIPPDHALILIKGKHIVVRTSIPLKAGQLAFLKVQQCEPQCVLKLLELRHGQLEGVHGLLKRGAFDGFPFKFLIDALKPAARFSEQLGGDKLPPMVTRMWDLLRGISLPSHGTLHPQLLKSFMDGSGMVWEHKLRQLLLSGFQSRNQCEAILKEDLKGLALKLSADGRAGRVFSEEAIIRFSNGIEQLQLWNVFGLEEKGRLLFTIPMHWHDGFTFAQLWIDLGEKRQDGSSENDENRVLRLSLFLEMSHLGPVRVDASVFQKEVRVGFLVGNEEIKSLVNDCKSFLRNQLERHGFLLQQVTCSLEESSTLANTCLFDCLVDPEEHYISLIV
jgi:hypothetical protein